MSSQFKLIELNNKEKTQLKIYEHNSPSQKGVSDITDDSSSDLVFKEKFIKIHNYWHKPAMIQPDLYPDHEDGLPLWIMASEMSPEDQAETTYQDREEAMVAYILLVLYTNKAQPTGKLNESAPFPNKNYSEIITSDVRDKYRSHEVVESLRQRIQTIIWKHHIHENNKDRYIQ